MSVSVVNQVGRGQIRFPTHVGERCVDERLDSSFETQLGIVSLSARLVKLGSADADDWEMEKERMEFRCHRMDDVCVRSGGVNSLYALPTMMRELE